MDEAEEAIQMEERILFRRGEGGYHTYRIPGMVVTGSGAILAFCEGRRDSAADAGRIDILMARSFDNGVTWDVAGPVVDGRDGTVGNPCPVWDRDTNVVWLFFNWNSASDDEAKILAGQGERGVLVTYSQDEGNTWADPVDLTELLKPAGWTWYAMGPGHGIQLANGRLVIPCNHAKLRANGTSSPYCCHTVYSDDHGATWKLGGDVAPFTNECQVVELADGTLYMNMRSYHDKNRRAIAISSDGGEHWTSSLDMALVEPVCHGSTVRYTLARDHGKNRLLFANPASTKRENMTVRLSYDEGQTWPVAKCLYPGPAAYPELAVAPDLSILCLYERGHVSPYEEIALARFSLAWLTDGKDQVKRT